MLHRLLEFEHFLILEHFSFTKILWGIFWHIKTHRDCWYLCSFRMVMKASCLPLFWDREFAQKKESVSFKSEGQETNQLNNGSITHPVVKLKLWGSRDLRCSSSSSYKMGKLAISDLSPVQLLLSGTQLLKPAGQVYGSTQGFYT